MRLPRNDFLQRGRHPILPGENKVFGCLISVSFRCSFRRDPSSGLDEGRSRLWRESSRDQHSGASDLGAGGPGGWWTSSILAFKWLSYMKLDERPSLPTLLQLVHVSGANLLRSRLPDCRRVDILDGCGHSCNLDRPRKLGQVLTSFHDDVSSGSKKTNWDSVRTCFCF